MLLLRLTLLMFIMIIHLPSFSRLFLNLCDFYILKHGGSYLYCSSCDKGIFSVFALSRFWCRMVVLDDGPGL